MNSTNRLKKCIKQEKAMLSHALKFPKARAVVYQTYSKNCSENQEVINKTLEEFNETKRTNVFPYQYVIRVSNF
jgi:16S rRNA C967 or C1407 C5-methylase (RsmB/RsmF family)